MPEPTPESPPVLRSHAEYTRVLAPLLPRAAFERCPGRVGYALLQLALFLGLAFGMRWTDSLPLRSIGSMLAGHALLGLALFAHELSHGVVLGRGALRRALELVAWGSNLVSPTVWRKVHNESHHRHANTARDPDRRFASHEQGVMTHLYTRLFYPARGGLRHNPLVLFHFVPYVVKHTLGALLPDGKLALLPTRVRFSRAERVSVALELLVIAAIQYGLFWLSGGDAGRYVFVGPLAVAWTSAFVMLYVFTNHFASPVTSQADPIAGTSSVIVPPFVDRLHLHFSYHTEHHLFPAIDSRYFPLLSRLLVEHFPERYQRLSLREAWQRAFEQPVFVELGLEAQAALPRTDGVESAVPVGR